MTNLAGKTVLDKIGRYVTIHHIDDLVGILLHAANASEVRGPVNATAPQAVTNREFTAILAKVLQRPAFLAVPATVLRLTLGEFAEVLLGSQRVVPEKILQAGFVFRYPGLKGALQNLLGIGEGV